ncbi:MAG: hypothetical protein K2K63_00690 [Acetatifactor sp.]|nr:hypothetical protein [Acetatifactor sp.]
MGKRKNRKQRILLAVLLLSLSLAGTGCGDDEQAKVPDTSWEESGKTISKEGLMSHGFFLEEDGIVISSKDRFLYSDWDPVEFDYICMDPTCSHLTKSCSARTIQDEASVLKDFSVIYQDRLIILHAYSQLTVNELSETVQEWSMVYQTDVYEADLDGSNRRKKVTFSGAIASPSMSYAAVLADEKLYFGGPSKELQRIESDAQGQWLTLEVWIDDAIYCLDLNEYTIETFAATEDKEIKEEEGYQYQLYEYDGMIYGIISNFYGDSAIWYRIDPEADVCEEILRFDSRAAWFGGAIGDTVYYFYMDSQETLYAKELAAGTEEREIMTVTAEGMIAMPFVLDGRVLLITDYCMEEGNHMAVYTVLDREGKVLDTFRYDEYINFLDVVADKILYFKLESDFKYELWWVEKEDLEDLSQKGVRIGPDMGYELDALAK